MFLSASPSIASGFLRFWDSLNFKKDREFVGITVFFLDEKVLQVIANTNLEIGKHSIFGSSKQDYNQANSSGMTYQQLKLIITSVMDSSLPRIALTMVSGKKQILLLKKDCDNPVNSLFQAEQQMEANFSGSSSTSRQNQKIDVGGRLIKGILQRSETA
ncbi:hypothetical protein Bca101_072389 [Brassica carinata]